MNLSVSGDSVRIEWEWYEQLWAFQFQSVFEISLTHVQQATTSEPRSSWTELRAPGTCVPGLIKAGTYYTDRGKEFWYVTNSQTYLTLELQNEPYCRIILTVDYNDLWCDRINAAIAAP